MLIPEFLDDFNNARKSLTYSIDIKFILNILIEYRKQYKLTIFSLNPIPDHIKYQLSNILRDLIDHNKIDHLFLSLVSKIKSKCPLSMSWWTQFFTPESYELFELAQQVIISENTTSVFRNYDLEKQPHLYNYQCSNLHVNSTEEQLLKIKVKFAKHLYIHKNGLNINRSLCKMENFLIKDHLNYTIQIRYDSQNNTMIYYYPHKIILHNNQIYNIIHHIYLF